MRSFQFLLDKPSSFCTLSRLFDGYNQCVGANSVAKGGQRVIKGNYSTVLGNEYLEYLKQEKCLSPGRKKALFTFHSFAVRGIVATKRSFGDKLDDFSLTLPTN